MEIAVIKAFFGWCTILNMALLLISWVMCVLAGDWAYGMHSKWFSISREAFNVAIYSFLGLYKVLIIVFNIIPYIALSII